MYRYVLAIIVTLGSFMLYLTMDKSIAYNNENIKQEMSEATYALFQAVDRGDDYGIIQSIKSGADVNFISKKGDTALHRSVLTKNSTITRLLIKNNSNPNIKNSNDKTSFDIAFRLHSRKITNILKQYKEVDETK